MRETCCLITLALGCASTANAVVCTPSVMWEWTASQLSEPCCTSPVVAQLSDDNSDGRIDELDTPDVLFIHYPGSRVGVITALDGATGGELFTTDTPRVEPSALAVGDLDGDGLIEIVAAAGSTVVAFEHDGTFKWSGDVPPVGLATFDTIGIADLDQDGSPEIYSGSRVFASDGRFLWMGTAGTGGDWPGPISNAVDLEPASLGLELLAGNTAYDARGRIVWQQASLPDGRTAVADFDGDGAPEVVLAGDDQVFLLDRRGDMLGPPYSFPGYMVSQPVIADLDGDGAPEVFVTQDLEARALEWTGAELATLWSVPTVDNSRLAAAAAFDFDGDGAAEIVYNDQPNLYIFDGTSGAVLWQVPYESNTGMEGPVIADLDGDCEAELVVTAFSFSHDALTAYDCPGAEPARSIWNQLTYHVSNVDDLGGIPRVEGPGWLSHDGWLAQQRGSAAVVPPSLGNTLKAVRVDRDVELSWGTIVEADSYGLYRDTDKRSWPPVPYLTGLAGPSMRLTGEVPPPPPLYFYRIVGIGCSGLEGP